ncbi:ubiquitin carboxyl-terminal hydrolase 7-like, partial [Ceratina calcarata]|uniref:Ubiquitin carboxyl-terminal hydrolase 7 n=1 Tax=Ceratina calcarata TaxID=156304 RepID=A0AAJ7S127_9HYME
MAGIDRFLTWEDVLDPKEGFLKDDSVTLEVHVMADAPRGVHYRNKCTDLKYEDTYYINERKIHTRLENPVDTNYINSALRTLSFANQLRKEVSKMPTEDDDRSESVDLAVQRTFYQMQFSNYKHITKELMKTINWGRMDPYTRKKKQKFLDRMLHDLEENVKETIIEGEIEKINANVNAQMKGIAVFASDRYYGHFQSHLENCVLSEEASFSKENLE